MFRKLESQISFLISTVFISLAVAVMAIAQSGISGSPGRIGRQSEVLSAALTTTESTTARISFDGAAGGQIFIPAGSPITTLTFYAGYDPSLTFLPLYTDDATTPAAVVRTVSAGKVYDLPATCFGCRTFKIVVNAAGTVIIVCKG